MYRIKSDFNIRRRAERVVRGFYALNTIRHRKPHVSTRIEYPRSTCRKHTGMVEAGKSGSLQRCLSTRRRSRLPVSNAVGGGASSWLVTTDALAASSLQAFPAQPTLKLRARGPVDHGLQWCGNHGGEEQKASVNPVPH